MNVTHGGLCFDLVACLDAKCMCCALLECHNRNTINPQHHNLINPFSHTNHADCHMCSHSNDTKHINLYICVHAYVCVCVAQLYKWTALISSLLLVVLSLLLLCVWATNLLNCNKVESHMLSSTSDSMMQNFIHGQLSRHAVCYRTWTFSSATKKNNLSSMINIIHIYPQVILPYRW